MIRKTIQLTIFCFALATAFCARAETKIVDQMLTGTHNWVRTNIYELHGAVFVRTNAVLNIEAGTVIKGHNLGAFGTNVAALYVCRGGKIFANGTARDPIIFTASVDDTTVPDDMGIWERGLWGGVVIFGRTPINGALNVAGNGASPKYEVYEGLEDMIVDGEALMRFGGEDENDNSGSLRYVSIRHGGAKLSTDKEINGLSLGAVGRGTIIDYVECYAIADDGFEFFGGTVNTKHLVSAFCDDDAFDTDMGYRGKNQFWFGIQAPDARNFGMELNNQINEIATADKLLPASAFQVYNMTLIGSGTANRSTTGGRNAAMIFRPHLGVTIRNSVITDFNERAIELDTRNGVFAGGVVTNTAVLSSNIWWGFVTGSGSGTVDNSIENISRNTIASNYWTMGELNNQIIDPMLNSISRTNVDSFLDPRPQPASPALTGAAAVPNDGFYSSVSYRGAFSANNLWITGWTALAEYGIVAAPESPEPIIVPQMLTGTVNWTRDNIYQLNGAVFVRSNAVLNIEAGTVIKGHNLGAFGTNVAALYVCRGGKIFAEGTPQRPIIFTADVDDTTVNDDMGLYERGLWGGVVVFGNTTINGALNVAGNGATPKYEVYEGLEDMIVDGEALFRFGGNDDADSSGVLRYVSIRHGGAKLSTDKEINGLSLGAVGSGTVIEFVEAYAIADDGFEFFGGTVNTKYLVSAFCDDDSFDTDMGYRGKNQFWFGIQAPDARNYGFELNNQINEIATAEKLLPASGFELYNVTMIGSGATNTSTTGGRNAAFNLRPYVGVTVRNSIFTDFNERAIELDTRNGVFAGNVVTNTAILSNNLWWDFVTGSGSAAVNNSITNISRNTIASNFWTIAELENDIANPMLNSISRNLVAPLDPRPATGSPAFADAAATPNDGFYTPVTFRGAFDANNLWIAKWTALSEYGVVAAPSQQTVVAPQMITGVVNWTRDTIYQLNGAVFVRSNAVLNIEAGTVIKGHNLGAFGTNVAALYVCRGGKIFANGTAQNPIIFTTDVDDTSVPDDMGIWERGLWGGVVILGQTTINGALNVAGNSASPKYEVYEGLEDIIVDGEALFRFGGDNDADNSGVFRYVSIRHGGAKLSTDKEINGLSLGAVGSGTVVEFVEAYAIADDGFEFFGGTVNTKYLVSAFCDDDTFDTDMGYRGRNQYWFGIQAPDARNFGMELNNQINEIATAEKLLPASAFEVYNMTLIGSGTANRSTTGGRNAAMIFRPYLGVTIRNSVMTDFNERAIELDTRNGVSAANVVTNTVRLNNNIWWGFVTGSGSGTVDNSIENISRNTIASNYWTLGELENDIVDPMLNSISRTNVGAVLDPRPAPGSPAFSDAATAPAGYARANYRGAFGPGRSNWASGWTALSEYSILTAAGAGVLSDASVASPLEPEAVITRDGGQVNITFATQSGFTYQVESTATLSGQPVWVAEGAPVAGAGASVTVSIPAAGDQKYLRIKVQ